MKKIISMFMILVLIVMAFPITEVHAKNSKKVYKAYYSWIKKKAPKGYNSFKLIKLDNNKTPELLAVKHEDMCDEYILCTYKSGKVTGNNFISGMAGGSWYAWSTSYIPKSGKLFYGEYIRSNGEETNTIYKLKNGKLKKKYIGYISPELRGYKWNKKSVSKNTYDKKLNKVYKREKAKDFSQLKYISKKKMLKEIKKKM